MLLESAAGEGSAEEENSEQKKSSFTTRIVSVLAAAGIVLGASLCSLRLLVLHDSAGWGAADVENTLVIASVRGSRWEHYPHYDFPNHADVAQVHLKVADDVRKVARLIELKGLSGFALRGHVAWIKGGKGGPRSKADLTSMGEDQKVTFFLLKRWAGERAQRLRPLLRLPPPRPQPRPQRGTAQLPATAAPVVITGARPAPPPTSSVCDDPGGTRTMYMYRAQNDDVYPFENVNAGDIPGVLWYLQNEVVYMCPRKYKISRIRRVKVTLRPSRHSGYVAFDYSHVTTPGHKHPVNPGCQGRSYGGMAGHWYSMPGVCPESQHKVQACQRFDPGGACSCEQSLGTGSCTYHWEEAGFVDLNELEGFETTQQYQQFCASGRIEYVKSWDKGAGMSFWDGFNDHTRAVKRVRAVLKAFKKKYPDVPLELGPPTCW